MGDAGGRLELYYLAVKHGIGPLMYLLTPGLAVA